MQKTTFVFLALAACLTAQAQQQPATPAPVADFEKLSEQARREPNSAALRDAIVASFRPEDLKAGKAIAGKGASFLFAIESDAVPQLFIDGEPQPNLHQIAGTKIWMRESWMRPGWSHNFHYVIDGKRTGGLTDVASHHPEAYEMAGVPKGKLSEKIEHTSKIYPGLVSNYWIYVPAQYDGSQPVALMIWQDGEGYVNRNGGNRTQVVLDNLMHQKRIPVMISIFISPGLVGTQRYRSIQYDSVDDVYPKFLSEEIIPAVAAKYKLRTDGYSRAIVGNSSGGICAFNAAWQRPNEYARVLSRIGTFTSIQWKPNEKNGGNDFPFMLRKEKNKRNIRVWLSDGSEDLENNHGSWPLQNIQMANSLKMMEYDFHFRFGNGTHNGAQGNSELPEALTWLWRDYDPGKTSQVFEMEPAEKAKPYFRVRIANRE